MTQENKTSKFYMAYGAVLSFLGFVGSLYITGFSIVRTSNDGPCELHEQFERAINPGLVSQGEEIHVTVRDADGEILCTYAHIPPPPPPPPEPEPEAAPPPETFIVGGPG